MNDSKELIIEPCSRWGRRLFLIINQYERFSARMTTADRDSHCSLMFVIQSASECSVMFDPPGIDEAALILGDCGAQFYMSRADGERIVELFGLRCWTRELDPHVPIPASAIQSTEPLHAQR